jgi:hypothetical protein
VTRGEPGEAPREEIYVSTDMEADGPIPGPHSMISIASAAFRADGELIGTWTANLRPLEGAAPEDRTTVFWSEHPDAFAATQVNQRDPAEAMREYAAWLEGLPGVPVFVAYPAGFDFTFVYWYLVRFLGHSPFSHSALDVKSFAMAVLRRKYRHSGKAAWPRHWRREDHRHTHVALEDALEQGHQFLAMLAESRAKTPG